MLYVLLAWAGIVAVAFGAIAMLAYHAKKQGEAQVSASNEAEANKMTDAMTEIVMTPPEPGETEKKLDDGTF